MIVINDGTSKWYYVIEDDDNTLTELKGNKNDKYKKI